MNISGTITQVLPLQSGISKSGKSWQKQEYVLQTNEAYPKTICFSVMGENIAKFNIHQGDNLSVDIDITSREYNGKWYHSITAWRVSNQTIPQSPYNDDPFPPVPQV